MSKITQYVSELRFISWKSGSKPIFVITTVYQVLSLHILKILPALVMERGDINPRTASTVELCPDCTEAMGSLWWEMGFIQ